MDDHRRSLCARNRLCYKYRSRKMLKKSASIVLGSSKSDACRLRFSEGGITGGVFPFAKIHCTGEWPHEVRSVPPPVLTRLRPCWTNVLSILWVLFSRHSHGDTEFPKGLCP